jgi:hypothetical protein
MIISSVYEDGEVKQFWEGFKRWDIHENQLLYNGFNKDGRIASGYIVKENNQVIKTIYSGFLPDGTKVFIEDMATRTDPDHFTTTTKLRMDTETAWRVVNTDHWVKVENQIFNENLE